MTIVRKAAEFRINGIFFLILFFRSKQWIIRWESEISEDQQSSLAIQREHIQYRQ